MTIKNGRVMPSRRPVTAGTSITSSAKTRTRKPVNASFDALTDSQKAFARQLRANLSRPQRSITAATNTSNIMAKPDFLELLPLFVQKLYIADVFGTVAMRSRQQLVPYFKFIAENTKGDTHAGDVLSSPFVNRQGVDPNFTGRLVKNELVMKDAVSTGTLQYTPVLPGSVVLVVSTAASVTTT